MATTKAILSKIKLNGEIKDLIAKSNGENVAVTYNGKAQTLSEALAKILDSITGLPNNEAMTTAIGNAIDELIGGAPETYNTLKEIADYITEHGTAAAALTAEVGKKVDKEEGKGLSAEDFTTILKNKLENLPEISATDVENWNNKASTAVATQTANGLMSSTDKVKLDGIRGVRVGETAPEDMLDGELFVQLVTE